MKSIVAVLQDFEKIVYKILMWIILIPKTIIQVIVDPLQFRQYVRDEAEDTSPFDEYISPVILLLVVAFLPAMAYNSLPVFGSAIHSPAETSPVTGRYVNFDSLTDFKAIAVEGSEYNHTWTVDKIQSDGAFEPIYTEAHREDDLFVNLERVDADTVTDQFVYQFEEPGDYYVNVNVDKVDTARRNKPTERYKASVRVTIPPRDSEPVTISSTESKTDAESNGVTKPGNFAERIKQEETIFLALALMVPPLLFAFASRFLLDKSKVKDESDKKDAGATDKNPTKPAGADKTITSDASGLSAWLSKYVSIGEETLKEQFYVQCYYFSPLSLAIWVTMYAGYFFTEDVFLYQSESLYWQIMLLPLILCVMWFLRTQVRYIAIERDIPELKAGGIALLCIALIGLGANIIFAFDAFRDTIRVWTIRTFPMIAILLMLAFFQAWFSRRKGRKYNDIRQGGALIVVVVILFFAVMGMIPNMVKLATPSASVVGQAQRTAIPSEGASVVEPAVTTTLESISEATATQIPVQSTPTPASSLFTATTNPDQSLLTAIIQQFTPTAVPIQPTPTLVIPTSTPVPSPFYVEGFDGDLASWFEFMTSGDMGMVIRNLELGKLVIQLLELNDKLPWYYLIKDGYSYSDVTVEAVVVNRGNNTNGVSLICRYSDIGWYEFVLSNSGSYHIYAVDNAGILNQGYNLIADGSSNAIKSGPGAVNTYSITCQNDKLELKVNGEQVKTLPEKNFKFANGLIGISVSSPNKLPVWVEFESLTVNQP